MLTVVVVVVVEGHALRLVGWSLGACPVTRVLREDTGTHVHTACPGTRSGHGWDTGTRSWFVVFGSVWLDEVVR